MRNCLVVPRVGRRLIALTMVALPISFAIRWRNDPMHNDADATRRKVFQWWNFCARLHILDDLILVLALMNGDLGYSKTGQISRDVQFRIFQLR